MKVLGRALYAADQPVPGLLDGTTVPTVIAEGGVEAIDTTVARSISGVVRIFTYQDFTQLKTTPAACGAYGRLGKGYQPMTTTQVRHRGEPVSLAIAETLEAAIEGAEAVSELSSGDAETAYVGASYRIDVKFTKEPSRRRLLPVASPA